MQYGYFDLERREYLITNPLTPTPWINYLGGGRYGGIISQTGGGYSFDGDPRFKRVLRYRYNSIPADQPGRYLYIRDARKGEYWSATWQPVKGDYDRYLCRHGQGYTIVEEERSEISSKITYFIPLDRSLEVWWLKLKNNDQLERKLTLFSYAEFSFFDVVKDQQNLDWTQQIQQGEFRENCIFWNAFMRSWDDIFMTCSLPVSSFETSREAFVGPYRDLANPLAVEKGYCENGEADRGNGAGILSHDLVLKPGEEREIIYLLGTTAERESIQERISGLLTSTGVEQEFQRLEEYWDSYLNSCQVKTPDQEMNLMLNTWNPYQCRTTFNWSRFVSLYQLGIDRGMGFRDSAQDTLGVVHVIPEEVQGLLLRLMKCQHRDGHAYHLFYPLTGTGTTGEAGEGGSVDWYSDDHLWLIPAITAYLKETGDFGFLRQEIPFADDPGTGTVLEHLCQALEFTTQNRGRHGLPLAGFADWNDTLNLDRGKGEAESVLTGMLYCYALKEMEELLEFRGLVDLQRKYHKYYQQQREALNRNGWDGDWYLRAYDDDGQKVGSQDCKEGQIFLNTQSWAILAGLADREREERLLESVARYLDTPAGVVLLSPAYRKYNPRRGGITTYPPGAKENGGVFLHTNPWLIIAETMVGQTENAYRHYRQILPVLHNNEAEKYEIEPYVYCQNILGKEHSRSGLGRNSWLTGTAAWVYRAAVNYILGVRPTYGGLILDPAVPGSWQSFSLRRFYRGRWLNLEFIRDRYRRIEIDKQVFPGRFLPLEGLAGGENRIRVYFAGKGLEEQ